MNSNHLTEEFTICNSEMILYKLLKQHIEARSKGD